jgi:hypothetical protein
MKRITLAIIAALLLVSALLVGFEGAEAGDTGDMTCGNVTIDRVVLGNFGAQAETWCFPPNPSYPFVDMLGLTVFWEWFDWNAWQWADGGVYEMDGCDMCTEVTSDENDSVPLPYYIGVNCRRAQTIHMIWPHMMSQTVYYVVTASNGECR